MPEAAIVRGYDHPLVRIRRGGGLVTGCSGREVRVALQRDPDGAQKWDTAFTGLYSDAAVLPHFVAREGRVALGSARRHPGRPSRLNTLERNDRGPHEAHAGPAGDQSQPSVFVSIDPGHPLETEANRRPLGVPRKQHIEDQPSACPVELDRDALLEITVAEPAVGGDITDPGVGVRPEKIVHRPAERFEPLQLLAGRADRRRRTAAGVAAGG